MEPSAQRLIQRYRHKAAGSCQGIF